MEIKKRSLNYFFGITEKDLETKTCVYCNEEKSLFEFPKHKSHYGGYDSRCKDCIKSRSKIVRNIKKTSPAKPLKCDCCGSEPKTKNGRRKVGLVLDHCSTSNRFRGWLCSDCNLGIGSLGDSIEGLTRALNYLKKNDNNI